MPIERAPIGREMSPEQEHEAFLKQTTDRLIDQRLHEWTADPRRRSREAVDAAYGNGMLQKLRGFQMENTAKGPDGLTPPERAYQTLEAPMDSLNPDSSSRLAEICERLQLEPPAGLGAEDASETHPYLTTRSLPPAETDPDDPSAGERTYNYHVNDGVVKEDIAFLKSARGAFKAGTPEAAALDDLTLRLEAFRMLDPKVAMQAAMKREFGGKTYTDLAGREMGRVALAGVLLAGTVIFGTIAIVNYLRKGELSAAPFLWGFATWLVADPSIINSFFSKDDPIRNDFDQIRRLTNNKTFAALSNRYGIGGEPWANAIEGIYDGNYGNILTVPNPTSEAVQRTAAELSQGDPGVEAAIAAMITTVDARTGKTDFALFVEALKTVDRDEAREFIRTYVATDSIRKGLALDASIGRDLRNTAEARSERGVA